MLYKKKEIFKYDIKSLNKKIKILLGIYNLLNNKKDPHKNT